MPTSKDYARPLAIEKEIVKIYGVESLMGSVLEAQQGEALRATIAAVAGEIVQAIDELRSMLNERP